MADPATPAKFIPADQIDDTFKSKYTGIPPPPSLSPAIHPF